MQLPAHAAHERSQAQFRTRFGWNIVTHYGDPVAEHLTARNAAGLVDRSDRGKIRITGPDRVAFLQALVTNDIASLTPGEGRFTLGLNHKGQVQTAFPVYNTGDSLLLTAEPGERAFTFGWLRRFRLRSKIVLADETESLAQFTLTGPSAPEAMQNWLAEALPLVDLASVTRPVKGVNALVAGFADLQMPGYDIMVPAEEAEAVWNALVQAGEALGARPVGQDAWESLRIESGVPIYGPELNESMLPPEARLEARAINYEKGCYPGQEIMARIRNRAHVNRFLRGLVLSGGEPPVLGTKVLAGDRVVGAVTSAAVSPLLGRPIAMAFLRREIEPGATVALDDGRSAEVVNLPFVALEAVR